MLQLSASFDSSSLSSSSSLMYGHSSWYRLWRRASETDTVDSLMPPAWARGWEKLQQKGDWRPRGDDVPTVSPSSWPLSEGRRTSLGRPLSTRRLFGGRRSLWRSHAVQRSFDWTISPHTVLEHERGSGTGKIGDCGSSMVAGPGWQHVRWCPFNPRSPDVERFG